jgi:hypothetical protein
VRLEGLGKVRKFYHLIGFRDLPDCSIVPQQLRYRVLLLFPLYIVLHKNFNFSVSSRMALGPTQLPMKRVQRALSPEIKWPWREADDSLPTNAEVKKTLVYIFTPHIF